MLVVALGIVATSVGVAVPAAEAAVQASLNVVSKSDPCIAGSCRWTVRDQSVNPNNEAYTVQFDCDDRGHIGSFVSDSGAGRPPGSQFTCSYPDQGEFLLQMRATGPSGSSIADRVVEVASRADAPAAIGYRGPSVFPSFPQTFEVTTPKRHVRVEYAAGGELVTPQQFIGSRFDGQQWHYTYRIWLAPVGMLGLQVKAWSSDETLADRRTVSVRVLKSSAFPNKGFRVRVSCIRTRRTVLCKQRFRYYAAKPNTVKFAAKFQVRVRGRWRTFATGKHRQRGAGVYFELLQEKQYLRKLKRRYRHKPIRARFAYRVIHRKSGPDKTVYFKRTRYKRIRISQ